MQFEIRASAGGQIMTGTIGLTDKQREKLDELTAKKLAKPLTGPQEIVFNDLTDKFNKKELPQTLKSYCEKFVKERLYDSIKDIQTKQMQKGHESEDSSIDFVCKQMKFGYLIKNEDHFKKHGFTGTPDVVGKDFLIDVKSSWDCFTFPLFETEIPDDTYFYQGQIYMYLTDTKKYHLCYVLRDTPAHLIQREAWYYCRNNGIEELTPEILQEYVNNMTWPNAPDSMKIKTFSFDYDPTVIEELKVRIKLCQKYVDDLINDLVKSGKLTVEYLTQE